MSQAQQQQQQPNFSFGNAASGKIDWTAVSSFSDVSPSTLAFLSQVYTLLTFGVAVAAFGAASHVMFNIGGLLTTLGALGALMYTMGADKSPANAGNRKAGFCAFTFFKGASIGPLVAAVLAQDPSLVLLAAVGTVAVFAAFTAVALYAPRGRNTLLLGGILGSGLSALLVLSLANLFIGSSTLLTAQLWAGLVLFSGFVAFDTQLIIMRAESGFRDEISAAIDLFIDVVAIFVRLLIILSKNSKNKKRDRRDRR